MQARVSQNGEIIIPEQVGSHLGIKPGDSVDVQVEDSRIILTTSHIHPKRIAHIITDPISGLPALNIEGEDVPVITNADVERMLVDFP